MDIHTRKTLRKLIGELTTIKSLSIFVLVTIILAWLPDGIAQLISGHYKKAFIQLGVSVLILSFLVFLARRYAVTELKYKIDTAKDKHFKVIIVFLSKDNPDIYRNINTLEDFKNKKLSWEMPLRAIKEHEETVERVIIIPSRESDTQFDAFKELISNILKDKINLKIQKHNPVDFENIEQIHETIENIYKKLKNEGYRERDIVVDITGGQKPVSIAGAASTVIYPDRYFQYVSTKTKEVKVYNMDIFEIKD